MYNISDQMRYTMFSNGNITFSTQSRKNKKRLVAAFPCSQALEPWFQGGDAGARLGNPGQGTLAARKCCCQPFLILPRVDKSYFRL